MWLCVLINYYVIFLIKNEDLMVQNYVWNNIYIAEERLVISSETIYFTKTIQLVFFFRDIIM